MDDRVHLAANPPVDSSSVTISAWVRPAFVRDQVIIGRGRVFDGVNAGWLFRLNSAGKLQLFRCTGAMSCPGVTSSASYTAGVWQHVAVVFDSSSGLATMYLNGSAAGSLAVPSGAIFYQANHDPGTDIGVQNFKTGQTDFFSGAIDDLRIYNRSLSQSELSAIFGGSTAPPPPPPPPTPQPLIGDLNNDNAVNALDWSLMNSVWFSTDPTADLNNDGIVNSLDFSILNRNWGA